MDIILFFQSFKNPLLDHFFQVVTRGGEQYFFIAAASWFIWCFDKETGWRTGFIFLSGTLLNGVLKDIFRVTRPIGKENVVSLRTHTAGGYSFPSGHTQSAALFWIALMKIYRKRMLYVAGSVIIFLVGISRLYLGVHWPSDVLGGAVIGAVWVFATDYIWVRFNVPESIKSIAVIISVSAIICVIYQDAYILKTAGAAAGFLSGVYLDKKFLGYTPSSGMLINGVRLIAGFSVIALIMAGSKFLLPAGVASTGISFTLTGFWISFGAPYLFIMSEKSLKND